VIRPQRSWWHNPLEIASFVALLFGDYIEKSEEGFVEDREERLA
jgi:hypothetical protein